MALAATAALIGSGCGGGDEPKGKPLEAAGGSVRAGDFGNRAVRLRGKSPFDVAGAAVLAAYPGDDIQPNGLVLTRLDRWRETLVGAQFAAAPVAAALLPRHHAYLPTATADLVDRMNLRGFPRASGVKAVVLGAAGEEVFASLQEKDIQLTQLKASSPPKLSLETVPFRGGWAKAYSDQIVVVPSQERDFALPGAAWSAYSGDTLAFAGRDSLPEETRALLVQRKKLRLEPPHSYVIGPASAISDAVLDELRAYGPVTRIAGETAPETAVALARFHDAKTGFGWGLRAGPASWSFVNPRDWGNSVGAFTFAAAGPQAPLLLTRRDGTLPPAVRDYLRSVRSPRGGQGFLFGDERSIPPATLREVDRLLAGGPAPADARPRPLDPGGRDSADPALPTVPATRAPRREPDAIGGGRAAP